MTVPPPAARTRAPWSLPPPCYPPSPPREGEPRLPPSSCTHLWWAVPVPASYGPLLSWGSGEHSTKHRHRLAGWGGSREARTKAKLGETLGRLGTPRRRGSLAGCAGNEGGGGTLALQEKGPRACSPGTSDLGVFHERGHNRQAAFSGMSQITAAPLAAAEECANTAHRDSVLPSGCSAGPVP